jgi:hypothetical protein
LIGQLGRAEHRPQDGQADFEGAPLRGLHGCAVADDDVDPHIECVVGVGRVGVREVALQLGAYQLALHLQTNFSVSKHGVVVDVVAVDDLVLVVSGLVDAHRGVHREDGGGGA